MPVRLGDEAPNFTAETTEGTITLYDYLGDGWGLLFSHPKDFTPVCTTELGAFAKRKSEFDQRGVKILGVSVDPLDSHQGWAGDIEETPDHFFSRVGDNLRAGRIRMVFVADVVPDELRRIVESLDLSAAP